MTKTKKFPEFKSFLQDWRDSPRRFTPYGIAYDLWKWGIKECLMNPGFRRGDKEPENIIIHPSMICYPYIPVIYESKDFYPTPVFWAVLRHNGINFSGGASQDNKNYAQASWCPENLKHKNYSLNKPAKEVMMEICTYFNILRSEFE